MTHFVVIVYGDHVEEKLAPFHEFECTGFNDKYVQEIDDTEEYLKRYKENTKEVYVDSDGKWHQWDDPLFYREWTEEEKKEHPFSDLGSGCGGGISYDSRDWGDGNGYRSKVHEIPEGYVEKNIPWTEYGTFAEYIEYETGRTTLKENEKPKLDLGSCDGGHKYGYTLINAKGDVIKTIDRTNPNSKWDWYQIGGRWEGYVNVKNDADPVQFQKKDLDLKTMQDRAIKSISKKYDGFWKINKGLEKERKKFKTFKECDHNRDIYWNQPILQRIHKLNHEEEEKYGFSWSEDWENYILYNKEELIQREKEDVFVFYDFIDLDGNWISQGEHGWWGAKQDNIKKKEWNETFMNYFDSLPDDTLITVVDCHT